MKRGKADKRSQKTEINFFAQHLNLRFPPSAFQISVFEFKMKHRRTILKILFAAVLLLVLLALAAFLFPKQVLMVDSGPMKADVLVVLGGGGTERPARAAELFKHGDAPKILVSGNGDCEWIKRFLEMDGVPNAAIMLESRSSTTRENAEFSIPLLRQMGAHRVIIVTSWFHSRRALACFEHYAPDITFYSRPSHQGYSKAKWNRKGTGGGFKSEYVKLLGYWVCYGVCPL
jgi:uncharacterized SAM-binding protein YcdF (DUF218 family)